MDFSGFREETFGFFRELKANNSEEWFDANQERFDELVVQPMRALVTELRNDLGKLNPALVQDDLDAHFSEMRRGPHARPGLPPLKTSFYCFFWDSTVRRLSDGWFFVGVNADGVTIGMSIYDFGDPESRMRRVFKPRLRRYLTHLDDYIKANYLRRGFDFHRYVRAAGKLGMREVEAFPALAADWDSTLGWVVKRHLHTESSRLTPGSFLTEVRESFERLYPLYAFTSDPREEALRLIRVPARIRAMQASGAATTVGEAIVAEATVSVPETTAAVATEASVSTSAPAKPSKKKPTEKPAGAKKKVAAKPAAKKATKPKAKTATKTAAKKKTSTRSAAKKKTTAKSASAKKPTARKKTAAKKKPTSRKKTAAKSSGSRVAAKRATSKQKPARGSVAGATARSR